MIIIVGAGIAGLSLAWHLIKSGKKICLIDQNQVGRGASWAATAYLEPRPGVGKMRHLEWQSVTQWPKFAKEVQQASQMDVDYQKGSQIKIAFADTLKRFDKEQKLREQGTKNFKTQFNADFKILKPHEALELEPNLSPDIVKAVLLPEIHWMDGRLFCMALKKAIENEGGKIFEHCQAQTIQHRNGKIKAIKIRQDDQVEVLECEKLVLCSGFGTNAIQELPQDIPKVRAIRGVAITYQMDKDRPLTQRLIKHPQGILCPRGDGRLIVGATHEEDEDEPIVTDQAINLLKTNAERTIPALKTMPIVETIAGIRASVGDGMLRLGQSHEINELYYALSQGGAGYLRAAIFGDEFSQYILGNDDKTPHIAPFIR